MHKHQDSSGIDSGNCKKLDPECIVNDATVDLSVAIVIFSSEKLPGTDTTSSMVQMEDRSRPSRKLNSCQYACG